MNEHFYQIDLKPKMSEGNYNTYVCAEEHPDRIMCEHDFVYILSGEWEIYQDDIAYTVHTDDVILLHAGAHHYGLKPCSVGTKTMYIHFSQIPQFDAGHSQDGYQDSDNATGSHVIKLPTVINCKRNNKVKELFADIINTHLQQNLEADMRINALICLLFLELYNCSSTTFVQENEVISNIIKLFQSNPDKHYTLEELSNLFFINPKTIDRYFLKLYKKSAFCYQRDTKLESAKQFLLLHPNATLREVAQNYGFYDEFHFSKVFKKKYGVSPNTYRHNQ